MSMVKDIIIRNYRFGEEEEIINLWNASLPLDRISRSIFVRKILIDPNFDPSGLIIAEDAKTNTLVGFIYVITRKIPVDADGPLDPDKAWIVAFGVSSIEWFDKGVGQMLLDAAEKYAKVNDRHTIIVSGYSPNYFIQGIDPEKYPEQLILFQANGYQCTEESVSMGIELKNYKASDDILALKRELEDKGFKFDYLKIEYIIPLFRYIKKYHGPGWVRLVRYLLNHTDDWERVSVVTYNGEVIGFNRFSDPDTSVERFGPFGVNPDFRGRGIGKVLLSHCLETMKSKGICYAWFQWTDENSAAGIIYKKAGFKVLRRYHTMQKTLKD